MKGFAVFARKEALEIVRTWRIWVLPCMALFFALSGPLMAKWTPQIVSAVGGPAVSKIFQLIPTPTYLDAYGQWTKNLTQIVLIAIIIIYGSLVSGEKSSPRGKAGRRYRLRTAFDTSDECLRDA